MTAGKVSPADLIVDITEGFYVTELMGFGVNNVTGDYSRGAPGFGSKAVLSPIRSAR